MSLFPKLFSSATIGNLELPNRIVMPAMHLGYCPSGEVTERLIEFYRLRARGGAGLIIVGGCGIDRIGNTMGMIQVDSDDLIPGLQDLSAAVHSEGAKIMAQLYQSGRYAMSALTGKQPVAPSPIPSRLTGETPHELTPDEIQTIIESFAQAARRVKESGFDGVEVLAGTGYLISEFFSPLTNRRTDSYGGSLENRMRFGLEVIRRIRDTVGPDYPFVVRVAGNDFMPGGNPHEEVIEFCQALERAGIDAINVTGGWHETLVPQITMNVPPGAYTYLARSIKKAVSIPVIASNRINHPGLAEEILQRGDADFVGIARSLIADPYFPAKAKRWHGSGSPQINRDPIRPCIACNQGCLDHVFKLKPIECMVNAEAGKEASLLTAQRISQPSRNILVIGAGAAGLEFARVASSLGHNVTVWEERDEPGGQLHLAAAPPGRKDFLNFLIYLTTSSLNHGVQIRYNTVATTQSVLNAIQENQFTDVVVAAGARPLNAPFSVDQEMHVLQAWDVLEKKARPHSRIVIIGGGAVGVETALFLAKLDSPDPELVKFLLFHGAEPEARIKELLTQSRYDITLLEMKSGVGKDIGPSTRWSMLSELKDYGIKIADNTTVSSIQPHGVEARCNGISKLFPADTVILALGSVPRNNLYHDLQETVSPDIRLHLIGDAQKPAKVLDAVHSAYLAAISL